MRDFERFKPGTYVVLEGGEGAGKSTQARILAARTESVLTRETGGTAIGQRLREILHDTETIDLDPRAEALIVAADRAQHITEVVRPALDAGRSVVSDRNWLSTLAYQGYGRQQSIDEILELARYACQDLFTPTRIFLLTTTEEELARRIADRHLDRFESAGIDFHRRVARGYLELAEDFGAIMIDATLDKDKVHEKIWKKCGDLLLQGGE